MKYFHSKTLDELKIEYRRLAKENHPDHGGDNEVERKAMAYRILSALSDVEKCLNNEGYITR